MMLLAVAGLVDAGNPLEKLLMPGPVVQSHADIEQKCEACHEPFSKASQDRLCLDCHKPIAADISAKTGFHGRSPLMTSATCNLCHTDHKGRDADIVQLDPPLFDHGKADFQLSGRHLDVACSDCHTKGRRWAEAPSTCYGCHKADQPHKGNLGTACETCHKVTGWLEVLPFDHGKTGFVLAGKHADVACGSCHFGEIYKGMGTACADCHAIQDVHRKRFGTDCQSCHSVAGWKPAKFDHARDAGFALKGAHEKAECAACHGSNVLRPLASTCFDCHKAQDVHKAQLGSRCGSCHSETGWREGVKFDHGLSNFPLVGLHIVTACESCHATPAFKEAKTSCAACHREDDIHKGRFTARCESCHTANGWTRVSFDHDTQTKFKLTGKHATVACYGCHVKQSVMDASLPTSCYSCHVRQDVHRGKFGQDCAACHGTSTFSTAFIRKR